MLQPTYSPSLVKPKPLVLKALTAIAADPKPNPETKEARAPTRVVLRRVQGANEVSTSKLELPNPRGFAQPGDLGCSNCIGTIGISFT